LHAEALETFRILFDVDLQRNKILIDEAGNPFVGINLGIQPSACASCRRRREIEEQSLVLKLRFGQRSINILLPCHGHSEFPLIESSASSTARTTRNCPPFVLTITGSITCKPPAGGFAAKDP
jgi:hypothetical protein